MKKNGTTRIVSHIRLSESHFQLVLQAPAIARQAVPGQFVQVQVTPVYHPLLRRPFSIQQVRRGTISLFYRVVGKGTRVLSERKPGESLNLLGPLGQGFTFDRGCRSALLIGGGMGVAPLVFLADSLVKKGIPVTLLFGQPARDRQVEKALFAHYQGTTCRVRLASEKREPGAFFGRVTELAGHVLKEGNLPDTGLRIFSCGPWPMFQALKKALGPYPGICQVSLEGNMACGFGACLGCAVKLYRNEGYAQVCKDGPVFNINEVDFSVRN